MKALLMVDIQNDFSPSGALPVQGGDEIIPFVNQLQDNFHSIIATQDWHPKNHGSFAIHHPGKKPGDIIQLTGIEQILWPVHCVENTPGADFIPGLDTTRIHQIIKKGIDPDIDSYSGFFDNDHKHVTGLHIYLMEYHITELHIVGLATDYCVKFTALDAVNLGYKTFVYKSGVRGVELNPGDVDKAFAEMKNVGIEVV